MKMIRLALTGLLLASPLPLLAQSAPAPADGAAVARKPKPSCPCDRYDFKPLNDKASAVAEFWAARRKYRTAKNVIGAFGLFAMMGRDLRTLQEAQNALNEANGDYHAARMKAESLGGVKVTLDGDEETIEILLVAGVDYELP